MPQPLKSKQSATDVGSRGDWRFSQSFGDRNAVDNTSDDVLSSVEYDQSGDFLATGDSGGRIVIYARKGRKASNGSNIHRIGSQGSSEYDVYAKFQSHEQEFDYLKSLEIEEKINNIEWCRPNNNSLYLLSTNDKTIKLWRIHDKQVKVVTELNVNAAQRQSSTCLRNLTTLRIPQLNISQTVVAATPRRIYANAHTYHINSIAVNSDGETYLSSDDLRVNLWNLNISNQSFNIVDIKPANMEELTEVITASDFHPCHCNIMMYSSSKGSIKIGDMRKAALCDSQAKVFEEQEDSANKSFCSEIIASISDVKFSPDGRYIIARDYLTLKIWDINMESRPVQTIRIHEHLRPKLCELYENDCIFDKFECGVSADGNSIVTGSYNNMFHIYDRSERLNTSIKAGDGRDWNNSNPVANYNVPDVNNIDFSKKILHTAWHPHSANVAVATFNNLYVYNCETKPHFLS